MGTLLPEKSYPTPPPLSEMRGGYHCLLRGDLKLSCAGLNPPIRLENMSAAASYKKLDHREHVLLRPGMYVGSVHADACVTWVYDEAEQRMVRREIQYIPALYKVFDEIITNAIDHATRLRASPDAENKVRKISVDIVDKKRIVVTNDGDGIDVIMHEQHGCYVPELIFGHLLTSTNYSNSADDADDDQALAVGGQNGIGAKACNIFSRSFVVETVDARRKLLYRQRFSGNMAVSERPSVTRCAKKPYTRVEFEPDFERFHPAAADLSDDMYALLAKRVHDATAVTDATVAVTFNGRKLECKTFDKYAALFLPPGQPRVCETLAPGWDVVVACSEEADGFQHTSFVNGVWTMRGGKHVDAVANALARRLAEAAQARAKKDCGAQAGAVAALRPQHLREGLFLFLRATVKEPTFDSQSKETLTTPAARLGVRIEIPDKLLDKVYRQLPGLVERGLALSGSTLARSLRKTDGRKQATIHGIPKLDDANWAGTARSQQCTLILTEGDSAKTMAFSGLDQVGRDRYGVFPLRGKIMNVCEVGTDRIVDNKEISDLKKILGLEAGKAYASTAELRYGRIMALTDADADGSHIKGLLFNLFHQLWPSLMDIEGFLTSMLTPIVKARKGRDTVREFYNMSDFERFREQQEAAGDWRGWTVKYYKGLATSTAQEAKDYFRRMSLVVYRKSGVSSEALDLAFNKKRADDRKAWLTGYDRGATLDYSISDVPFEDFVNKDLIHFSHYDVQRSIPSAIDGLKVSQRKVLFAMLKRRMTSGEVRVASLSGLVQAEAAYHHGDASLNGTIVGLAQDYVGSNNLNLLEPIGQFGSRLQGGKDSGSPRYIHTRLAPVATLVFHPDDADILTYLEDDGDRVEPENYLPVIPMVLVNGALGIGTGFSTNVPCYNPLVLVDRLLRELDERRDLESGEENKDEDEGSRGDPCDTIQPWYRGFKGTIAPLARGGGYASKGVAVRASPTTLRIQELPVGTWTDDFRAAMDQLLAAQELKKVDRAYGDDSVSFTLHFPSAEALTALLADPDALDKKLMLASNKYLSTSNMYLFDARGSIKKYHRVVDVMRDFSAARLDGYVRRRAAVLARSEAKLAVLRAKVAFIEGVVAGDIPVAKLDRAGLEALLQERGFQRLATQTSSSEEDQPASSSSGAGSYDHLVRMPITSLTLDRRDRLAKEADDASAWHDAYESKSPGDLWREDLQALRHHLVAAGSFA